MIIDGVEFERDADGWYVSPDGVKPMYSVHRTRGSLGNYKGTRLRREGGFWYWSARIGFNLCGLHHRTRKEAVKWIAERIEADAATASGEAKE